MSNVTAGCSENARTMQQPPARAPSPAMTSARTSACTKRDDLLDEAVQCLALPCRRRTPACYLASLSGSSWTAPRPAARSHVDRARRSPYARSPRHVDVDIARRVTRQPVVREDAFRDRPSKVDVLVVPAPAKRCRIDLKDDHRKGVRVDACRQVPVDIRARFEYHAEREGIEQEGLLTREDRPQS